MSSARQRRRNSTRKAGGKNLTQSQGGKGFELTSLESSGSPRNWPRGKLAKEEVTVAVEHHAITRSGNSDRLHGV